MFKSVTDAEFQSYHWYKYSLLAAFFSSQQGFVYDRTAQRYVWSFSMPNRRLNPNEIPWAAGIEQTLTQVGEIEIVGYDVLIIPSKIA